MKTARLFLKFDINRENDAIHNPVDTREELLVVDPGLAKLCAEHFGKNPWRYVRADDPSRKDEPHLKSLDRSQLKPFAWTKEEQAAFDALERNQHIQRDTEINLAGFVAEPVQGAKNCAGLLKAASRLPTSPLQGGRQKVC